MLVPELFLMKMKCTAYTFRVIFLLLYQFYICINMKYSWLSLWCSELSFQLQGWLMDGAKIHVNPMYIINKTRYEKIFTKQKLKNLYTTKCKLVSAAYVSHRPNRISSRVVSFSEKRISSAFSWKFYIFCVSSFDCWK